MPVIFNFCTLSTKSLVSPKQQKTSSEFFCEKIQPVKSCSLLSFSRTWFVADFNFLSNHFDWLKTSLLKDHRMGFNIQIWLQCAFENRWVGKNLQSERKLEGSLKYFFTVFQKNSWCFSRAFNCKTLRTTAFDYVVPRLIIRILIWNISKINFYFNTNKMRNKPA